MELDRIEKRDEEELMEAVVGDMSVTKGVGGLRNVGETILCS